MLQVELWDGLQKVSGGELSVSLKSLSGDDEEGDGPD